jgi:hypothetical protein
VKKDEVEFHSDGFFSEARPAVNVKVRAYGEQFDMAATKFACENISDLMEREAFILAYMEASDDTREAFFEAACEDGWEQLQQDAEEIFGSAYGEYGYYTRPVKVESEGRSGGWAVVEGLPDFDSWDAIMLGKWARFAKLARSLADDVPYAMAELFYLNRFEDTYDQRQPMRRALVGAGMGV